MFEPDTTLEDILINLRFMERHIENPFNFCRAEAYAGTGLETRLRREGRLLGDYFGFDYRLKDPQSEAFHQIANYAFFDRNFSDYGLHYFNMQVDFFFQLLKRFRPELISQTMRSLVRNFIKRTNLDTYECLSQIYDFVACNVAADKELDITAISNFARRMRLQVDERSRVLHQQGEEILRWLTETYEAGRQIPPPVQMYSSAQASWMPSAAASAEVPFLAIHPVPYRGLEDLENLEFVRPGESLDDWFGVAPVPIPYTEFKNREAKSAEKQNPPILS
jgi:hypothetical protein